jgi:hypothetical protein
LERDIGEKEEINMNKKIIVYTEAPKPIAQAITDGEIIADFLPLPEELIRNGKKVQKEAYQPAEILVKAVT